MTYFPSDQTIPTPSGSEGPIYFGDPIELPLITIGDSEPPHITVGERRKELERKLWRERNPQSPEEVIEIRKQAAGEASDAVS